jgi:hypothetical protein
MRVDARDILTLESMKPVGSRMAWPVDCMSGRLKATASHCCQRRAVSRPPAPVVLLARIFRRRSGHVGSPVNHRLTHARDLCRSRVIRQP